MEPLMETLNGSGQSNGRGSQSHQSPDGRSNPIIPGLGMPGQNMQFALLDYFFPGFSVFQGALLTYLGIDLNFFIPLLVFVFAANYCWSYVSGQVWAYVEEYLMSTFRVRSGDEIYDVVMHWVSQQEFSQKSRNFLVSAERSSRSQGGNYYYDGDSDNDDDDGEDDEFEAAAAALGDGGDGSGNTNTNMDMKQALQFTPSHGTHHFWHRGRPLILQRIQTQSDNSFQGPAEREELSISCLGRNPRILKEILREAHRLYQKKDHSKTLIYRGLCGSYGDYWQRAMSRPNRPFSTVVLDEDLKQRLIDDVADYLNPATRRWYSNRGIPYRRGYLMHGPPGTGKSSLSFALAGHFRMKIYMVNLSSPSATEESLLTLFSQLPHRCLVLLEDIDSAGLTHTREKPEGEAGASSMSSSSSSSSFSSSGSSSSSPSTDKLSLSGLLNLLDGVASQEGRILIMTTNHLEKLDKALIRPGRVDMLIGFKFSDRAMTQSIFRAIYAPYENEAPASVNDSQKEGQNTKTKTKAKTKTGTKTGTKMGTKTDSWDEEQAHVIKHIADLAVQFSAKIPELEFSPAEIQGLLLQHKRSPEGAIEAVEAWVSQTRREKKEKELREAERRRKELEEEEKRKKEEEEKKEEEKKAETS